MLIEQSVSVSLRRIRVGDLEHLTIFFEALKQHEIDRFFHPHPFDAETAKHICEYSGQDWYAAQWIESQKFSGIGGYVMLRGWDAGFKIPSFGVCVHPDWQGIGLGRLLIQAAITVACLRQSPAIRLKVYPDNDRAIALYSQFGFKFQPDLESDQRVGLLALQKKDISDE